MPKAERCLCYTQQGTKLDTGPELCKQIAEGGFFVAWDQPAARAVPVAAAVAEPKQVSEQQSPRVWGFDGTRRLSAPSRPDGDAVQDGPPSGRVRSSQGRG